MKPTVALIDKPLSILGILVALHTIVVGVGFLFITKVKVTPLYQHLNTLLNIKYFGVFLIIVGIVSILSYCSFKVRLIKIINDIQCLAWLFIFFGYLVDLDYFVGTQNALFWAVFSTYISFTHFNNQTVDSAS